jgi:hypothetical protein
MQIFPLSVVLAVPASQIHYTKFLKCVLVGDMEGGFIVTTQPDTARTER